MSEGAQRRCRCRIFGGFGFHANGRSSCHAVFVSRGLRHSVGPKLPSGNVVADSSLFFATAAEHEIRTCERGTLLCLIDVESVFVEQ